jgi:hypothetical protein
VFFRAAINDQHSLRSAGKGAAGELELVLGSAQPQRCQSENEADTNRRACGRDRDG